MHEMSICANIIDILKEQAETQSFRKVVKLSLGVGQLSDVESDALQFGFEIVARGSIAEGAELHIEQIDGRGWCSQCSGEVPLPERFYPCPDCGTVGLTPCAGTELKIQNIEVL
ncbi:hydrogenase maturation nickel metallochaperone HypA [Candidatus Haliotispira prima]|uniref:Hydrogenase maturation factor HypA n=1 Tax=Candidatus Haliotispira prima TaxID=3034016 RepID=A0ABY8MHV6_9SPIO|nr:hydrogenase maturation nickel metallochaperone HypA [Candidatus Haliotispira prima]